MVWVPHAHEFTGIITLYDIEPILLAIFYTACNCIEQARNLARVQCQSLPRICSTVVIKEPIP